MPHTHSFPKRSLQMIPLAHASSNSDTGWRTSCNRDRTILEKGSTSKYAGAASSYGTFSQVYDAPPPHPEFTACYGTTPELKNSQTESCSLLLNMVCPGKSCTGDLEQFLCRLRSRDFTEVGINVTVSRKKGNFKRRPSQYAQRAGSARKLLQCVLIRATWPHLCSVIITRKSRLAEIIDLTTQV